uniref:hypothetical protein n=1 Tax=Trichocoleus desertorum TaxID=1481672 RepID=UPI0025B2DADF|nr:hypothetical protein [Trichocoleus desertorum]
MTQEINRDTKMTDLQRAAIATSLWAFAAGCLLGGKYLENDNLKKVGYGGGAAMALFIVTDVINVHRKANQEKAQQLQEKPMNICSAIQCPFANVEVGPGKSSGCSRYSSAWLCHLRANHKPLFKQPHEYWLFANLYEDAIAELKQENDAFIAGDESSQLQLETKKRLSEH